MYVIWETSPTGGGGGARHPSLQRAAFPAGYPRPLSAPEARALGGAPGGGGGGSGQLQHSAPSAQDTAARARLIDAVRCGEEGAVAAVAAAVADGDAELQQLLPLQRLASR